MTIDPFSTDTAYAAFPKKDLEEVARGLGEPLKVVTSATLTPDRQLYNSCLSAVLLNLRVDSIDEVERSAKIAELADQIYTAVKPAYEAKQKDVNEEMGKRRVDIHDFVESLDRAVGNRPFNPELYKLTSGLVNFPESWQRRAYETYQIVRTRKDAEEYKPSPGWDTKRVVSYWCERKLEFKLERRASRALIQDYIDKTFPNEQRIQFSPPSKRKMVVFTGGMASGKSLLTRMWSEQLEPKERAHIVYLDSDYLKYPLFSKAVSDGTIPPGTTYNGTEVHTESSNMLYELSRKLIYQSKTGMPVPNVAMNSVFVTPARLEEALAGGGFVEVHNISMDPEKAIEAAKIRAKTTRRMPAEQVIRDSAQVAAENFLLFTQYKNANVVAYLYDRESGQSAPHYTGVLDMRSNELFIEDIEAFRRLAARAKIGEKSSQYEERFIRKLMNNGVTLLVMDDVEHNRVLCSLSPDGTLSTHYTHDTKQDRDAIEILKKLALRQKIGEVCFTLQSSDLKSRLI